MNEFPDENIAELHYNHHIKRRIKNLLRINTALKAQQGADNMPSLSGPDAYPERSASTLDTYMTSPQPYGTTRNVAKKSQAMMHGLAQRSIASKSLVSRP